MAALRFAPLRGADEPIVEPAVEYAHDPEPAKDFLADLYRAERALSALRQTISAELARHRGDDYRVSPRLMARVLEVPRDITAAHNRYRDRRPA